MERVTATPLREDMLVVDGFFSPAECEAALEELAVSVWTPSMVYVKQGDGKYRDIASPLRVSETAQQRYFSPRMQELSVRAERRMKTLFGVAAHDLESWQATTYPRGGRFFYHLDAGYWDDHWAGDRVLSFLLYLTTPTRGGGTHFRALDMTVAARAGRLLVWNNLFANGDADYGKIHSSEPLLAGNKTTLVTWQRQKRYRNGKG